MKVRRCILGQSFGGLVFEKPVTPRGMSAPVFLSQDDVKIAIKMLHRRHLACSKGAAGLPAPDSTPDLAALASYANSLSDKRMSRICANSLYFQPNYHVSEEAVAEMVMSAVQKRYSRMNCDGSLDSGVSDDWNTIYKPKAASEVSGNVLYRPVATIWTFSLTLLGPDCASHFVPH